MNFYFPLSKGPYINDVTRKSRFLTPPPITFFCPTITFFTNSLTPPFFKKVRIIRKIKAKNFPPAALFQSRRKKTKKYTKFKKHFPPAALLFMHLPPAYGVTYLNQKLAKCFLLVAPVTNTKTLQKFC